MLSKTGSVVGEHAAESWQFVQRGLWWSGLRLGEALNLHWTDDSRLCVDFSGRRPMFRIRADAEKGNKERVLPMAPEFAELLDQIPPELREGHVFNPKPMKRQTGRLGFWTVSTRIASIGRAAAVKVAQKGDKAQFASAHDLRRAFGFRWSRRVMPAVLQELMRHETISTTMEFYVGQNAEATADVVWAAVAKQSAKRDELHSWKSSDQSTETL
jgi:integrase